MKQTSNGRSMIEMLCVLAIIGLLSAVTLWIITRAQTKNRVNVLLHDVSVAFLELAEKNDDGVYGITFTPESSKQIMVEKGFYNDGKITGVVIVNGIDQSECQMIAENNKLDKMTFWQIDETEAGYLKRPLICADDTQIIFTQDYQNIYTCNNGCPDEAECNYENECKCPRGYVIDAQTGTCEVLECPIVSKIENIQDYDCCYKYYGVWDEVQGCYCQEGEYFNSQRCTPYGSFCSYKYEADEPKDKQADCYYDYTSDTPVAKQADCYYDYTSETPTVKQADCYYDYSVSENLATLTTDKARGGCDDGYYCALFWSDADCSAGIDETKRIYGACSPKENVFTVCPKKSTLARMEAVEQCPQEEFCVIAWEDEQCNTITQTTQMYYGTCEQPIVSTASSCPKSD